MEIAQVSMLLSSVTRINNTEAGYTVTTTAHEQNAGRITSTQSTYTVYDGSAQLKHDSTPQLGQNVNTTA